MKNNIHGFCDASEVAYGAWIYIRSEDVDGNVQTKLLCSKERVAPLKTVTLPRLELCVATILANLYHSVIGALDFFPLKKPFVVFFNHYSSIDSKQAHSLKNFYRIQSRRDPGCHRIMLLVCEIRR